MLYRSIAIVMFIVVGTTICLCQRLEVRLNNQDIIEMTAIGFSNDLIVDKIRAADSTDFDTSVPALKILKGSKVSETVIRAMINPRSTTDLAPKSVIPPPIVTNKVPEEAGVYVVLKEQLVEVRPEIVNWQTGGVLKTHATLGIVKGDVNGKIMRAESLTRVSSAAEFIIKTSEGSSVEEYQLLRLHEKNNRREFRAITGGVLHVSGGAQRDELSFEPYKIATRTWRVKLEGLVNGEYGFLPPSMTATSIASSGKMFTFAIVDSSSKHLLNSSQMEQTWNISRTGSDVATLQENVQREIPSTGYGSIGVISDEKPNVRHDGVPLSKIIASGPADNAGIKAGDVILAINSHYLFTVNELNNEVHNYSPGTKVAVRYRRYSTIYDVDLIVGESH